MSLPGLPLVQELSPAPDLLQVVRALRGLPHLVVFDSAQQRRRLGRYSFVTADPLQTWQLKSVEFGCDPFEPFERILPSGSQTSLPGLPPFQGGIAGLLGYELGGCFEKIPLPQIDEFQIPVLAAGWYDWVLAWDHEERRAWIISQGWPETDAARREERAARRVSEVLTRIAEPGSSRIRSLAGPVITPSAQFSLPQAPDITSNFSREAYLAAIQRVINYIHAGDIFQANLTQRLLIQSDQDSLDVFERLRQVNPAPFAGYLEWEDWAVISASPERFLRVDGSDVETRPIKGTRKRRHAPEADLFTRDELRESEKDHAENIMIVDLLRNDLSRVCDAGTIQVPQLCGVETYETVQHLVSEVRGRLHPNSTPWDLLRVTLPGGSISGAPKVRAMQIISELEPTVRGPYCGSLFYMSANGQFDSNLLIRTFVQRGGWLACGVGGGIVAQSIPVAEYEETLIKAAGMLRAVPRRAS